MMDHEIAQIINQLLDVAKEFGQSDQLRERLNGVIEPHLKRIHMLEAEVALQTAYVAYLRRTQTPDVPTKTCLNVGCRNLAEDDGFCSGECYQAYYGAL